jgi:hypothetical protein
VPTPTYARPHIYPDSPFRSPQAGGRVHPGTRFDNSNSRKSSADTASVRQMAILKSDSINPRISLDFLSQTI